MRFEGKLERWDEARGFGSIEGAETRERLFVHISAFERGRVRPPIGTRLEFEVARDAQGCKHAVNVRLPGDAFVQAMAEPPAKRAVARFGRRRRSPAWTIGAIVLVLVATGAGAWRRAYAVCDRAFSPRESFAGPQATERRCDGRKRCSQMASCAEAPWFLKNCPGTQLDGDHDGLPCEQQWCSGPRP